MTLSCITKQSLLGVLALALSFVFAASDRAQAQSGPVDWSGPYVGAHAGGAWLDARDVSFPGGGIDGEGFIGGGLVGFNMQVSNVVLGVEADFSFADLDGANRADNITGFIQDFDIETMGSIRGRAGYAINQFLVFGTAGFAIADVKAVHTPIVPDTRAGATLSGFTAGAGIEWAAWDDIIIRAEYLYTDLGGATFSFVGDPHNIEVDDLHVVRAAVIWRFGSLFGQ